MHNHEHKINIKVKPIKGLCIGACLCSKEMLASLKLHEGCPPTAPCSNSVVGPIQHDMQGY
jgi:hypothetical protein